MRGAALRISAIVEALVEAGATPEMILSAVSVAEAHALDALEQRRASDRARQQRRRQRLARQEAVGPEGEGRHATAGDSPVTERDAPLPDKERSPTPPKEINPTPNPTAAGPVAAGIFSAGPREGAPRQVAYGQPEARAVAEAAHRDESPEWARGQARDRPAGRSERRRRGTRLPDAFVPDWDFAAGKGFGRTEAEAEFEKFRDYWSAKAGREATKLDWQATWRNWIRNAGRPRAFGGRAPPGGMDGKGNFRAHNFSAHQDEVQRELDRALGRTGDDDFTGTTFELERRDWQARR